MNNFSKLGLSPSTIEVLDKIGFHTPTPVQEKAIPVILQNNPTDFIGLAQTGTGKTAAFGLPLIELIDIDRRETQALIMAPTRELGQQIAQQLTMFAEGNPNLNVVVVYGGAAISGQIRALKKSPQIVVATPGRLIDLIERKAVNLQHIRYAVLDEADEMLNMGFKEDIDSILSHTPDERVTWLFSATMPSSIRQIVKKYLRDPHEVQVNSTEKTNVDITHQYVVTKTADKLTALRRFLDIQPEMRGVMFCRTKRDTQRIADDLGNMGYGVEALHGDLSQAQRDAVMKRFKRRSMQLLIATDVAARGIDVNDLTHVIHHNLPDQLEGYTHRSGRTARAGKKGVSLAFINSREMRKIQDLEKRLKISFEPISVPGVAEIKSSRIRHWAELIANTKVDDQAGAILKEIGDHFSEMSKDDLLKRLITTQLDHLMAENEEEDLNVKVGKGKDGKVKNVPQGNRYFINLGTIDGLTKADLVHFLADVSRLDRRAFTDISLQKNCAYFNVDPARDNGIARYFKGIEIEGRKIRVNADDDGPPSRKKPKSKGEGNRHDYKPASRRRKSPDNSRKSKGKRKKRG